MASAAQHRHRRASSPSRGSHKRYGEAIAVGRPERQGFVGSLVGLGAAKGVFVTTSNLTKGTTDSEGGESYPATLTKS